MLYEYRFRGCKIDHINFMSIGISYSPFFLIWHLKYFLSYQNINFTYVEFWFQIHRPLCRTVADAVHVLDAIVGYDALDAKATKAASKYIPAGGYVQFLRIDGLKGKRIGIPDGFFDFPNGTVRKMVYKQHLNTMR